MFSFQGVVLAGGSSSLYPLDSLDVPTALLPVGNQPLLTYPLRSLEQAGVQDVLVVCCGDDAAGKVSSWVAKNPGKLRIQVKAVPEETESGDALRAVEQDIRSESVIVICATVVTDIPLKAVAADHFVRSALCTSVFVRRKASPSAGTKPGRAPKGVDYVGLDEKERRLLFLLPSPETKREVKVAGAVLSALRRLTIHTGLTDARVCLLRAKPLFHALAEKPELTDLHSHVIPYLVRQQFAAARASPASSQSPEKGPGSGESPSPDKKKGSSGLLSATSGDSNRKSSGSQPELSVSGGFCGAYIAPSDQYAARASTLQAYNELNRDVVTSDLAARLGVQAKPNVRHDNFLHESVQLGPKATVAAGCMVGRGTSLGERASVKRSVVGAEVRVGAGARIINSTVMDGCVLGDGCQLQNTVLCRGAQLQDRVSLRDCQVGADYRVSEGLDLREETLAAHPPGY